MHYALGLGREELAIMVSYHGSYATDYTRRMPTKMMFVIRLPSLRLLIT